MTEHRKISRLVPLFSNSSTDPTASTQLLLSTICKALHTVLIICDVDGAGTPDSRRIPVWGQTLLDFVHLATTPSNPTTVALHSLFGDSFAQVAAHLRREPAGPSAFVQDYFDKSSKGGAFTWLQKFGVSTLLLYLLGALLGVSVCGCQHGCRGWSFSPSVYKAIELVRMRAEK